MARTQNNTVAAQPSREEVAQQITAQLLASINAPKVNASLTDRMLQYGADKIADAGNGIAELTAGFEAAQNNFAVHRESARLRQQQRTAEKVAALVEQQLRFKGL